MIVKRLRVFLIVALLSSFMLTGGWCERYEAKQRRFEYTKGYLDTMRAKANRRRDSVRAADEAAREYQVDSSRVDSVR